MLIKDLIEIESKNPITILDEQRGSKKNKKMSNKRMGVSPIQPFNTFGNNNLEDEIGDEEIDGDEDIINRRLPLNTYNYQP